MTPKTTSRPPAYRLYNTEIIYEPLSKTSRDIQLAKILPGEGDDPIQVELRRASLDDDLDFTALSYTWGDARDRRPVIVNGQQIRVTRNLRDAFQNIRESDESVRLLADALCINQEDVVERDHQVFQMRDIYMKASKTIIYLGNNDGSNTCASAWNFLQRKSDWIRKGDPEFHSFLCADNSFRGGLEDVEVEVLNRPWFRRI
jgi:hypothetical protein